MLRPVTFLPDPLSDPRSLHESNPRWLVGSVCLSMVAHVSLTLALPSARPPSPPLAHPATEVFDVDPPPPPQAPPEPEPEPEPPIRPKRPPIVPRVQGPSSLPDAPAPTRQAAAVLTAPDDTGPLDFTDRFVTGQASSFSEGSAGLRRTSSRRTGTAGESTTGTLRLPPAGAGTPLSSRDQSRRVSVVGGFAWSCPFPAAANSAGIDLAIVQLRIQVDARGRLGSVAVVADPGHGFGDAARRCAATRQFLPALDRDGAPVPGELVIRVRFTR